MNSSRTFVWLGPIVATALAFAIAATSLHYVGAERVDSAREDAVSLAAKQLARTPSSIGDLRGQGFEATIVGDDPEPRAYRYVHRLVYVDHQTRPGQRLTPPADRDDAEAWRRGRRGRQAWSDSTLATGVSPIAGGRVAIIRSARESASFTRVWAGGGIAIILMLLLWSRLSTREWLAPKWRAVVGPVGVGLALLCMLWFGVKEVDGLLTGLSAAGAGSWTADASAMVTASLLPMVWIAVHGFIREGAPSPHRLAYAYIAPAIIGLGVLVLLPFVFGIILAFFRYDGDHFSWVGLQHFIDILSSRDYPVTHPLSFYFTLVFTIFWTGLNVVLHVGIGLGLALLLNRPTLRFKGLYRVLLIIPWAVPSYITALIWKGMFNQQFGLINAVLGHLGIEPVGWFSGFWTAFAANLSTNTWLGFPFMMVVALGALQSIPKDLYEAARVDGANSWQQFRNITLPLLKPAMLPAVIMGTVWTFNMFNIVYLVSGGRPEGSTDILITEAYRWAFERERYGYAAAYSLLIFFVLLGYSLLTQRVGQTAEEGRA